MIAFLGLQSYNFKKWNIVNRNTFQGSSSAKDALLENIIIIVVIINNNNNKIQTRKPQISTA